MMDCPTCGSKLYWATDDGFEDLDGQEYLESFWSCGKCMTSVTVSVPVNYSNIPALGEE